MRQPMVLAAALLCSAACGDVLEVTSVSPTPRIITAPVSTSIAITFDHAIDPDSITPRTFWAFGRWSGTAVGAHEFSAGNTVVTLVPDEPFMAGEHVTVYLSHDIVAEDGSPIRGAGYSFQFWTRSAPADMDFQETASLSTRAFGGEQVRSYGGCAPDLDDDGYPDLAIVNEISADVRVFMNRDDGSGEFDAFLQPTFETDDASSPSETGDFDLDGNIDMVVSNSQSGTVSILLGNGDGTFAPQQLLDVADGPYAMCVLDHDGDGDQDVVVPNWTGDLVTVLVNDGDGVFAVDHTFETGGDAERVAWAADMDEDFILDLVIGAQDSSRVYIRTGNGDGTFDAASSRDCGGPVRTLVCGDLDGDGHEDVATANGLGHTAGVLFGNGDGTLQSVDLYAEGTFTGATDLADLDGDGDLDWSLSHFQGDWVVLENDGDGGFTEFDAFAAPQVASCSILADLDRDGDVDIVLIDEFENEIFIRRNGDASVIGEETGDEFGRAVANVGDVDGDGVDDYAVGAPFNDDAGSDAGKVYVLCGFDGDVILEAFGEAPGDRFGWCVAPAGDLDGDDVGDVIVGAPKNDNAASNGGAVYVISTDDGSVIMTKYGGLGGDQLGYSVAGGIDVDKDGTCDLIAGAPRNDDNGSNAGRVLVWSGADGGRLKRHRGVAAGDRFGWAVAAVGRANADGHGDYAVGAPQHDGNGSNSGRVVIYSGDDHEPHRVIDGASAGDQFGRALAGVGRADDDARDDLAVGSPYAARNGSTKVGRVDLVSGASGEIVWTRRGWNKGDRYGWSVGAAGDVDHDGFADVAAGAPWHDTNGSDAGRAEVRSGATGSKIIRVDGLVAGDRFGWTVAATTNIVVGAPRDDAAGQNAGRVYEIVLDDAPPSPLRTRVGRLTLDRNVVGVLDVLASWGACDGCDADVNDDGVVDVLDLLALLETRS